MKMLDLKRFPLIKTFSDQVWIHVFFNFYFLWYLYKSDLYISWLYKNNGEIIRKNHAYSPLNIKSLDIFGSELNESFCVTLPLSYKSNIKAFWSLVSF